VKKIGLFLGSTSASGGTFQYNLTVLEAVTALPEDEYEAVIAYSSECWKPILERFEAGVIRIKKTFFNRASAEAWSKLHLPLSIWRKIAPYFHPATKKFLNQRCDLWIFPSQDSWSFWIPVPAMAAIHDLMHRYESRFPEVSAHGEYRRRETHYKRMCDWVQAILVDSEVGRQHVMDSYGYNAERIFVLPFMAPKYIYSTHNPPGFDNRYHLPPKFFFYPAHFWEHKNHVGLIRATNIARRSAPDIKLVFAGGIKNGYESSRRLVSELNLEGHILFVGYVPDDDMPEVYRRARALIMPTYFGPTNIPPLEAFVTGCPVAASNIYGMPEQLGDAALLFGPSSDNEIAQAMLKLWTDDKLCKTLAAKGLERAKNWNQAHFNLRLLAILNSLNQYEDLVSGHKKW